MSPQIIIAIEAWLQAASKVPEKAALVGRVKALKSRIGIARDFDLMLELLEVLNGTR